jgi:hypothetical protein
VVLFGHTKDLLLVFLTNMPFSIKVPPYTHRVNLNGKKMTLMINLVPGGLQHIQTLDGYIIPLSIQDGLTHLKIRPYTD